MPSPEIPTPHIYLQAPADRGQTEPIQTVIESEHIVPLPDAISVATRLARSKGNANGEFFHGLELFTKTLPVPRDAEALSVSDFAQKLGMDTETVGKKVHKYQSYFRRTHSNPIYIPKDGALSPKLQQILTLSDVFTGSRNPRLRKFSHLWWKDADAFLDEYWSWVPLKTLQNDTFKNQFGRTYRHNISELRSAARIAATRNNMPLEIGILFEPRGKSSRMATISMRLQKATGEYLKTSKKEKMESHRSANGGFFHFTLGTRRPEVEKSPLPLPEPRNAPMLSKRKRAKMRLLNAFKRSDEPLATIKTAWILRAKYLRTLEENRDPNFIEWLDESLKSKIEGYVENKEYAAALHFKLVRIENNLKNILF